MRRRARDLRPASGANASPGLPVGRSILAFLFDLDETSSRGVIEALTADASLEGSLQPTLPVGAFVDFLNRLKRQASHESTQQLLGHIRRFNALDVASLDEGGPDSAPAVFRRLVAFHSGSLRRAPAWQASEVQASSAQQASEQTFSASQAVALLPMCIEKFVALRTYTTAFAPTFAARKRDDALMRRCSALRSFVTPAHLDLPAECDSPESAPHWELVCFHLTELNRYRAPGDKCACLANACTILSAMMAALSARKSAAAIVAAATSGKNVENRSEPTYSDSSTDVRLPHGQATFAHSTPGTSGGADDLLPALVLALLRCNPRHLSSNVDFIREYHAPDALRSEAGYYLTHVESAVAFIEGLCAKHLTGVSAAEFEAVLTSNEEAVACSPAAVDASVSSVSEDTARYLGHELENQIAELPVSHVASIAPLSEGVVQLSGTSPTSNGVPFSVSAAVPASGGCSPESDISPTDSPSDASHDAVTRSDEAIWGSRPLPSRVLVLTPEELLPILVPAPPTDPQRPEQEIATAEAVQAWLQMRLRFMNSSVSDLQLKDLQPLLDEYRNLARTAQNLRFLLLDKGLLPELSTMQYEDADSRRT